MFFGRFIATLSSGQIVYEKIVGENITELPNILYMGWSELLRYCKEHHVRIVGMKMRFRSVTHCCKDNASEYFVNMSVINVVGGTATTLRGLGFRVKRKFFINWFNKDGKLMTMEVRDA